MQRPDSVGLVPHWLHHRADNWGDLRRVVCNVVGRHRDIDQRRPNKLPSKIDLDSALLDEGLTKGRTLSGINVIFIGFPAPVHR